MQMIEYIDVPLLRGGNCSVVMIYICIILSVLAILWRKTFNQRMKTSIISIKHCLKKNPVLQNVGKMKQILLGAH